MRLANTKYLLIKGEIEYSDFKLINSFSDVNVNENTATDSVAKWYKKLSQKQSLRSLVKKKG